MPISKIDTCRGLCDDSVIRQIQDEIAILKAQVLTLKLRIDGLICDRIDAVGKGRTI